MWFVGVWGTSHHVGETDETQTLLHLSLSVPGRRFLVSTAGFAGFSLHLEWYRSSQDNKFPENGRLPLCQSFSFLKAN